MSQILSLVSALGYGTTAFLGGLATRRRPAVGVVSWSQLYGLPILGLGILLLPPVAVTARDLIVGTLAGFASLAGLVLMYQALATGRMAVAAPIIGVVGATLPVLVDLATGTRLEARQAIGIALAIAAILVVGSERIADLADPSVAKAVLAGLAIGAFFVLLHGTSEGSGLVPLIGVRAVTVPVGFAIAGRAGGARVPSLAESRLLAGIGVVDMGATVALALALQRGPLGVSAVLASLSPAVTVVLAAVIVRQHPTARQWAGVTAAVLAVAMLSI